MSKKELVIVNPTGLPRRDDPAGSGAFAAPRGWRLHPGTDWLCKPGQPVKAPIGGKVNRIVYPYGDSRDFQGLEIVAPDKSAIAHVFYLVPMPFLLHRTIEAGDTIGYAQDVRRRYPKDKKMKPHIHVTLYVNMELLLEAAEKDETP